MTILGVTGILGELQDEILITENGIYDVRDYATANVRTEGKENLDAELNEQDELLAELESSVNNLQDKEVDLNATTATVEDILDGKTAYISTGKVTGTYKDMLQGRLDSNNNGRYLFYSYEGENLEFAKNLDTSRMTNAVQMFGQCTNLKKIDFIINMNKCGGASNIFNGCGVLEEFVMDNLKVAITIAGSNYGTNYTLDTLISVIRGAWVAVTSKTLTMGATNIAKLQNVYVRLVEVTDDMKAQDPYITNKAPFEICQSTDVGAMTIIEYFTTQKNWTLA